MFISLQSAIFVLALVPAAAAEDLTACPSTKAQAEISDAAGSSIDALMNAVAVMERRYGPPHSRKRVSDSEVRLIYRSGKGAVSVSLERAEMGRITIDCIAY